jgi:polysaccharide pyruvyl transferase WcaK-like protein
VKGNNPVITLLGSNSGNNLGDAAILSSILEHLTKELPDAEFIVPTTKPSFTNTHYSKRYNVKAISMMPWTGSIRFVGIPTFAAIARSDVALICDGILFGKKLWNPFFNWLIALIFVLPFARLVNCKVVCFSCGIGPFQSKISQKMAKFVLNLCDLVIMRENDSKQLAIELGCEHPIEVTGDAAFINPVSDAARGQQVAKEIGIDFSIPTLGINVTKYMDTWLNNDEKIADKSAFLKMLASSIKRARSELNEKIQVVVFCTHPMDEGAASELASMLDNLKVFNSKYLSHDIQAVMRQCQLFMGMRFHSVVLASAVEVPIIGLIYMPKVRGFMRLLNCEDYSLELGKLTEDSLTNTLKRAWNEREQLKSRQKVVIDELKRGALRAATLIRTKYFPNHSSSQTINVDSAANF